MLTVSRLDPLDGNKVAPVQQHGDHVGGDPVGEMGHAGGVKSGVIRALLAHGGILVTFAIWKDFPKPNSESADPGHG